MCCPQKIINSDEVQVVEEEEDKQLLHVLLKLLIPYIRTIMRTRPRTRSQENSLDFDNYEKFAKDYSQHKSICSLDQY